MSVLSESLVDQLVNKYKCTTTVSVKSSLEGSRSYGHCYFAETMARYKGTNVTIIDVFKERISNRFDNGFVMRFQIEDDSGEFYWSPEMLNLPDWNNAWTVYGPEENEEIELPFG